MSIRMFVIVLVCVIAYRWVPYYNHPMSLSVHASVTLSLLLGSWGGV